MSDDLREQVLSHLVGDALVGFVNQLGHTTHRKGGEWVMLCPFHPDKKPSMYLNPRKREGGIFKCFSCGAGGDVFDFVGELNGVENFRERLKLVAEMIGIHVVGAPVKRGPAPVKREVAKAVEIPTMTPAEVLEVFTTYKRAALPVKPWAEQLGVDPRAFEIANMVVAPYATSPDRIVLVAPMRSADGTLVSLRFRCFETKRRWSLDVKERRDGQWEQTKRTTSGLMACPEVFDPDICLDGVKSIVIEGETDQLGGITIMLRTYSTDPAEWPARFIGLPGVGSCHDELLKLRQTALTITLFDADEAGRRATFWHRSYKVVQTDTGERIQVEDLDRPRTPGLLQRYIDRGLTARAAFPPRKPDGSKFDLRDMAREGWDWHRLYNHLLASGTADAYGIRHRRSA